MRVVLALAVGAGLAACASSPARPAAGGVAPPDSAEYAVWSAVLRDHIPAIRGRMAVIIDSTWTSAEDPEGPGEHGRERLAPSLPAADALFSRFEALNERPHALRPAFEIGREYRLLPAAEMRALFRSGDGAGADARMDVDGGWRRFHERFPAAGGVVRLSRVAFSPDGTWAMMYYDVGCGGLCGNGNYLALRRDRGTWRVVADIDLWIS